MENTNSITAAPAVEDLKHWINKDPAPHEDPIWILETNVNFMDDGLAIMEELMQPLVNGPMNEYKLIELTRSQAKALYGSLTYLQMLHEKLLQGIEGIYKGENISGR